MNNPKRASQEVTSAIQDIKVTMTEKGTSDINAIFHSTLTAIIITFQRFAYIFTLSKLSQPNQNLCVVSEINKRMGKIMDLKFDKK